MEQNLNGRPKVRGIAHLFIWRNKSIAKLLLPILLTVLTREIYAQQCMKDATDGLTASSFFGSGESFGSKYGNAFDNSSDASSKWSLDLAVSGMPSTSNLLTIGVNFGTSGAKILTGYLISSANTYEENDPEDWKFQGSNNGTTWTDLDTRSGQSFSYRGQSRVYKFNNTTAYLRYRVAISKIKTPSIWYTLQIGELEFYEKVCLEGLVTDQTTPVAGVTVTMLGENYSVSGGGGNVLATAMTNAAGKYAFNAADIPNGQFSLIVEPPKGYQIQSNAGPFFSNPNWITSGQPLSIPEHMYTYDGSILFQNFKQLEQGANTGSVYWDNEQSNAFTNRFSPSFNKSNLNFVLQQAQLNQTCVTLNGSPTSISNLIKAAENGTFGSFSTGTGAGSYVRAHPGQPGFSKDFANTVLYNNSGFVNPANTQYTYSNRPNQVMAGNWGSGVLSAESQYTVTSYIGTLADIVDGNNTLNNSSSLLNVLTGGWRKTYGSSTGDVYDKFLIVNGAANDMAIFSEKNLSLKAGRSYLFSFDGKNANASTQNITTPVTIPYRLVNASNAVVLSGSLTLPPSTGAAEDDPASAWQKLFTTLTPPLDGVYSLEIRYPGGQIMGNDFYLDNISLRALTDYGDAPLSYGDAIHNQSVDDINANCDPLLTLGTLLDIEDASLYSISANGDNNDNLNDEDGVSFPALNAGSTSYSVSVNAKNLRASAATLYGWIDWNHNGTFDTAERASVSVPAGTTNGTFTLTWNSITTSASVYARFRLGLAATAASPTGMVTGGEVEDYLIVVVSGYKLTGQVWNDANKNLIINGAAEPGTDITSMDYNSVIGATADLTVYVTDNTGKIIGKATVNPDGTYAVDGLAAGTFKVTLSNDPSLIIGTTPASIPVQLPVTWSNTGISFPGSTGQVPNASSGQVTISNANVVNVNFGIEKEPQANPFSAVLPTAPTPGQHIPLNGTWPSTGTPLSQLTGRDLEDANTPNGLNGANNDRTVVITTPISPIGTPTSGGPELWYNGQPIASYPAGPNGTGHMIANYDADLLEVRTNGTGYTGFTFDYAWVDKAGVQGSAAPYTVSWTAPVLYSLEGYVFDDGNNNSNDDFWVDFIGEPYTNIRNLEYNPTIAATANLTVYVTNSAGLIVGKTTVDATGNYKVDNLAPGSYKVTLSNDPSLAIGTTPSVIPVELPQTWVTTGTYYYGNNLVPGATSHDVVIISQNLSGLTFGIEKKPEADPYSFVLATAPVAGQHIPLNGTWASTGTPLSQLTGRDLEDANTPKGLNGTNSDRAVVITTPVSPIGTPVSGGPELWYNGQPISSFPAGPNGTGHMIANYNADLLEVRTNGTGYTGFKFDYAWVDEGGVQGTPAPYTVSWTAPLPVTLLEFNVKIENSTVILDWKTTLETNASHFEIERSKNAKNWSAIGSVNALGESTQMQQYGFSDIRPLTATSYYRLKMIDKDNSHAYSRIQSVQLDDDLSTYIVYPNPVANVLFVKVGKGQSIKSLSIINGAGISVFHTENFISQGVDVKNLPNGLYIVDIEDHNTTHTIHKVIINR